MLVGTGIIATAPGGANAGGSAEAEVGAEQPAVESLFDTRSPGARHYGWMVDTKPDRYLDEPIERVLSSVRHRPAAVPDSYLFVSGPITSTVLIPDADMYDTIPMDFSAAPEAAAGGSMPIGSLSDGVISSGGTGGGGAGGGGGISTPVVLPVTSVPEMATWVMMLLGFTLLGVATRRRRPALALSR